MSVTLAHPFRIDSAGRAVTVEQGSGRHAAEAAGHVLACGVGERPLAPLWGLSDPSGSYVDADEIRAVVGLCDPDLALERVEVTAGVDGRAQVDIDVNWTDEGDPLL